MGIAGLLNALKSVTYNAHLEQFSGLTAAIDTFCWLHRGTYACSTELCIDGDSDKYVQFCLGRIELLQRYKIKPIMVFDGGYLPMKSGKEDERDEKRRKNLAKGMELFQLGNRAAASQYFSKAVDVTFPMAFKLIVELQKKNIDFVVAPYEADAQLAYLSRNGLCDLVISEDSDCLAFGCKMVMFKLEKNGTGEVIDARKLPANQGLQLHRFTEDMFLDMCILSGCDYLPSIPGIGLKTAHRYVHKYKKTEKILRGIRYEGNLVVPPNYEAKFREAKLTFRHQRVYCPNDRKLKTLTPLPPKLGYNCDDLHFLGSRHDDEIAEAIAEGRLDPFTMKPPKLPLSSLATPNNSNNHTLDTMFAPKRDSNHMLNSSTTELCYQTVAEEVRMQSHISSSQFQDETGMFTQNNPSLSESQKTQASSILGEQHVPQRAEASMVREQRVPQRTQANSIVGEKHVPTVPVPQRQHSRSNQLLYFGSSTNQISPAIVNPFKAPRNCNRSSDSTRAGAMSSTFRSLKPQTRLADQPLDDNEPGPIAKKSRHFSSNLKLDSVHRKVESAGCDGATKPFAFRTKKFTPAAIATGELVHTNCEDSSNVVSDEENFSPNTTSMKSRKIEVNSTIPSRNMNFVATTDDLSQNNKRKEVKSIPIRSGQANQSRNVQEEESHCAKQDSSKSFGSFAKFAFKPAIQNLNEKPNQRQMKRNGKIAPHVVMRHMFYEAASSP